MLDPLQSRAIGALKRRGEGELGPALAGARRAKGRHFRLARRQRTPLSRAEPRHAARYFKGLMARRGRILVSAAWSREASLQP